MTEKQLEQMPQVIKNRIEELDMLIAEHPYKIPTVKAAKYLKMDVECFKRAIEQGKIPFALGCDNDVCGNRYSYVSTLKFYLWCVSPCLQ